MSLPLTLSPEVTEALAEGRPVVALESTIITHGMPWPQNAGTARAVEAAVRAGGAVPATIAILDGRIRVGLDAASLERLARMDGAEATSRLTEAGMQSRLSEIAGMDHVAVVRGLDLPGARETLDVVVAFVDGIVAQ